MNYKSNVKRSLSILVGCGLSLVFGLIFSTGSASAQDLTLLFMGDQGHHVPQRRFQDLAPALEKRGIRLHYTDQMKSLNAETLAKYDGLVLYANIDQIEDEQAEAVLNFVASGKGFVPLHCATYCWRNNEQMVELMGAQFKRHGGQVFSTKVEAKDHPVMKGYESFTSWDETYVHHKHNDKDRVVLEYRVEGEQAEGNEREPWTWVRTHGKGRVFYTAWGHDQRTFRQPGYHNLVERGIRWACGDDPGKVPAFLNNEQFDPPAMKRLQKNLPAFEFVDVGPKIPNYTPSNRWGVQGKLRTLMQKPLVAENSQKHFVAPVGLAVKRFADEQLFQAKPIAMTWDELGRLWICETIDYPNELGKSRDRIRICEDTDGDGVADKSTIFAEGLSIPASLVIFRGGVIVQNGNQTIYLKDTNGDDVADQKTVLMTGFNLGDTHAGVSNFRYGLDNWIWAMQGYNNSRPKFGDQEAAQSFRQGFWRFKLSQTDPPQVTEVEFVRSSNNNTWGLGISEEGLIFGSTANGNPSMFMPIPNRYYEKVRGWAPKTLGSIADSSRFLPITDKVRQVDFHGSYTAGAGHALYTARAFPKQWWNKTAFVCGPTGHLIGTFVLRRDGANYTSTSPINLLASDDEWSAPIMAEVGPDGAVWVIDWYNYIVQHNPTPKGFETGKGRAYKSDLRDKRRGRIYRVVPEDESKLHSYRNLTKATDLELVQTLQHPSMRWRLQAQRVLVEKNLEANVIDALGQLIKQQTTDEIGLSVGAIHALRVLEAHQQLDDNHLNLGLRHPSAGVRRNAIAVLPQTSQGLSLLLKNAKLFSDSDMQVRLQAALTLSDMPASDEAGKLVAKLVNESIDPVIVDALTAAAATHAPAFLEAIANSESKGDAASRVANQIAEHIGRSKPDAKAFARVIASLKKSKPAIGQAILDGLTKGLPSSTSFPANAQLDQAFQQSFGSMTAGSQAKLVRLAGRCGSRALDAEITKIVKRTTERIYDEELDGKTRVIAARDLIGFQPNDADAVEAVLSAITPQASPELATELLDAIKSSNAKEASELLLGELDSLTPKLKSSAINVLLSKTSWSATVLAAAEAKEFDLDQLSLEQKQMLASLPDSSLREKAKSLLAQTGGLPDADREKVIQSMIHVVELTGDVDNGKAVFKRACANCHRHGEMGANIGPNLTGMAVHPKEELLTHILDPSRSVEGNFRLYNVATLDGELISGMLAGESKTSITIIDSQAKSIDIQREDIDAFQQSRLSVMPEGFENQINPKDMTDLLEFLTDTGNFVAMPLDDIATAVSTKSLFHANPDGKGLDRMVFSDWQPKVFRGVTFLLTDPKGQTQKNIVLLNGPNGSLPPLMPKLVSLSCGTPIKAIHMLSGVGGWSHPYDSRKSVSMIVRLTYKDGSTEDHKLLNGVHFADYIRRVDVPKSEFAFDLNGRQIRYLSVMPKKNEVVKSIEFVKGEDQTAPMIMAVTLEKPAKGHRP